MKDPYDSRLVESFVEFPFPDGRFPENLGVIVADTVMRGDQPVRYVAHTPDNDWWISDGVSDPTDADVCHLVHMSHLLDLDPAIQELASLPVGQEADRDGIDDAWQHAPFAWATDD